MTDGQKSFSLITGDRSSEGGKFYQWLLEQQPLGQDIAFDRLLEFPAERSASRWARSTAGLRRFKVDLTTDM